ncbi:hypothetical protein VFPPC_17794 [Pochonia chlamydosporia 170]|uniref:Uncharacterized protein n=1 Tax=Pochonia chlamydosporia 170 TaxID=1380566 RepID=A0A219AQF0_METCM|nr:hypothetical protein VFPPC_17794 [Pochonia chlamydosporia 170]OWT43013.1 hypothetical protein VFPPC_17794 [Pochonia chlamydosporia 170]
MAAAVPPRRAQTGGSSQRMRSWTLCQVANSHSTDVRPLSDFRIKYSQQLNLHIDAFRSYLKTEYGAITGHSIQDRPRMFHSYHRVILVLGHLERSHVRSGADVRRHFRRAGFTLHFAGNFHHTKVADQHLMTVDTFSLHGCRSGRIHQIRQISDLPTVTHQSTNLVNVQARWMAGMRRQMAWEAVTRDMRRLQCFLLGRKLCATNSATERRNARMQCPSPPLC